MYLSGVNIFISLFFFKNFYVLAIFDIDKLRATIMLLGSVHTRGQESTDPLPMHGLIKAKGGRLAETRLFCMHACILLHT